MEILIGLVALIVAILTFKFSFFRKPKDELEHLKIQFKATQNLSNKIQNELTIYISKNNASNEIIFGDITCSRYLSKMKESSEKNLSDKLFDNFDELKLTKPTILSMTKSLEEQFNALLQVQTFIELKKD
ncbi:hypothetical protein [Maribellus maritimus]|uniref:hypothetical protein n=1 Tax=Maribellus maritimus TaxID=2870838 RepID=UPI001EEC997F|nr:hypothetical protein [Maribellus maritimus]MCG6189265.1 hypothetical protein [Maribellus maritimus]